MSAVSFTNELPMTFRIAIRRERVLRNLDRLVFASLLLLIPAVAIPYGTVEPWWLSLYACAIFGLGAFWICHAMFAGWQLREMQLLAPLAALTAFAFLQSVHVPGFSRSISADPFETRLASLKLFALAINAALLLAYTSNHRRLHALVHTVIGVTVASALFGIIRQAIQHTDNGFVLPYLHRNSGFGQFVNKNHFAFLAEMAIGLQAGLIVGGAVRRERLLLYLAPLLLMWTGLFLTNCRGALLATGGEMVFVAVMLSRWRKKPRESKSVNRARWRSLITAAALSACLLMVVLVTALWLGGDLLVTRLGSLPGEIQAAEQDAHAGVRRYEVWSATWQLIKAQPIAGSGVGAYGIAITSFHKASGKWTPEAAHNDYLELLAAGGVIGVALALWFGLVFIKHTRRELSNRDQFRRAACLGAVTGIVGVLVHNTVDFGLHVTANSVIFIALLIIATRDFGAQT